MSLKSEFQKSNLPYLLVAFLVALGLWYTLNAREEIERVVDVRIDYKGLPPGLIVTGGQINKVSVRFRGPKEAPKSPLILTPRAGLSPSRWLCWPPRQWKSCRRP